MMRRPPRRHRSLPVDGRVDVRQNTQGVQRTASGKRKLAMMRAVFEKKGDSSFDNVPKKPARGSFFDDDAPKHMTQGSLDQKMTFPYKVSSSALSSSSLYVPSGSDVVASARRRTRRRLLPLFLLLLIASCIIAYLITPFRTRKGGSQNTLGSEINKQLSQEVRTLQERAHHLEEEEDKVRGEVRHRNTEFNDLVQVEHSEKEKIGHIEKEVDRLKKEKERETIDRIKKGAAAAIADNGGGLRKKQENENDDKFLFMRAEDSSSLHMVPIQDAHGGKVYQVTKTAATQIKNYRQGTGLILHLHITHHGGTSFCNTVGHAPNSKGRTPSFACWKPQAGDGHRRGYPRDNPWRHDETTTNVARVRRAFHFISWEYETSPKIPLTETNWEDPNLVSILIVRDPISRLLAGDQRVNKMHPGIKQGHSTREEWESYAKTDNTNNFALKILAGKDCCDGEHTDRKHLETAKALISRFTFVLDIECLNEGIQAVADILGLQLDPATQRRAHRKKPHRPNVERIPFSDIYESLLRRNRLDLELYEWSKSRSLISCSSLSSSSLQA